MGIIIRKNGVVINTSKGLRNLIGNKLTTSQSKNISKGNYKKTTSGIKIGNTKIYNKNLSVNEKLLTQKVKTQLKNKNQILNNQAELLKATIKAKGKATAKDRALVNALVKAKTKNDILLKAEQKRLQKEANTKKIMEEKLGYNINPNQQTKTNPITTPIDLFKYNIGKKTNQYQESITQTPQYETTIPLKYKDLKVYKPSFQEFKAQHQFYKLPINEQELLSKVINNKATEKEMMTAYSNNNIVKYLVNNKMIQLTNAEKKYYETTGNLGYKTTKKDLKNIKAKWKLMLDKDYRKESKKQFWTVGKEMLNWKTGGQMALYTAGMGVADIGITSMTKGKGAWVVDVADTIIATPDFVRMIINPSPINVAIGTWEAGDLAENFKGSIYHGRYKLGIKNKFPRIIKIPPKDLTINNLKAQTNNEGTITFSEEGYIPNKWNNKITKWNNEIKTNENQLVKLSYTRNNKKNKIKGHGEIIINTRTGETIIKETGVGTQEISYINNGQITKQLYNNGKLVAEKKYKQKYQLPFYLKEEKGILEKEKHMEMFLRNKNKNELRQFAKQINKIKYKGYIDQKNYAQGNIEYIREHAQKDEIKDTEGFRYKIEHIQLIFPNGNTKMISLKTIRKLQKEGVNIKIGTNSNGRKIGWISESSLDRHGNIFPTTYGKSEKLNPLKTTKSYRDRTIQEKNKLTNKKQREKKLKQQRKYYKKYYQTNKKLISERKKEQRIVKQRQKAKIITTKTPSGNLMLKQEQIYKPEGQIKQEEKIAMAKPIMDTIPKINTKINLSTLHKMNKLNYKTQIKMKKKYKQAQATKIKQKQKQEQKIDTNTKWKHKWKWKTNVLIPQNINNKININTNTHLKRKFNIKTKRNNEYNTKQAYTPILWNKKEYMKTNKLFPTKTQAIIQTMKDLDTTRFNKGKIKKINVSKDKKYDKTKDNKERQHKFKQYKNYITEKWKYRNDNKGEWLKYLHKGTTL